MTVDNDKIEEIVKNIFSLKSESKQLLQLENLTNKFRSGERNSSELLKLINLQDCDIIWFGIYIIGEVVIQNASTRKSIIDRLRVLANHNNSKIRYATLISLGGLIEEEDDSTAREFYFKMSKDKDKAISSIAKKWLSKF